MGNCVFTDNFNKVRKKEENIKKEFSESKLLIEEIYKNKIFPINNNSEQIYEETIEWLSFFIEKNSLEQTKKDLNNINIKLIYNLKVNKKKDIRINYNISLNNKIENNIYNNKIKKLPHVRSITFNFNNSDTKSNDLNKSEPVSFRSLNSQINERKNSIYIMTPSSSLNHTDSENSKKSEIKFSYSLFLDCIYDGLTYLPLINYVIENKKYTKDKIIIDILSKSIKGKNDFIFDKYKKYIPSFSNDQAENLIKICMDINNYIYVNYIHTKFINKFLYNITAKKCIIYFLENKVIDSDTCSSIISVYNDYLISPELLAVIYKNNITFLKTVINLNICNIINILRYTDVNTYKWENIFAENKLIFLEILNQKILLNYILDNVQKIEYTKLFFEYNKDMRNIYIFLDIFQIEFDIIANFLTDKVKFADIVYYNIFNYYYKNDKILHFSTILIKKLNIPNKTEISIKKDVSCFISNYNHLDKKTMIIEILKFFINID